jgi:hypothetical protein
MQRLYRVVFGNDLEAGYFHTRWNRSIMENGESRCIEYVLNDILYNKGLDIMVDAHPNPDADKEIKDVWRFLIQTGRHVNWSFAFKDYKQLTKVFRTKAVRRVMHDAGCKLAVFDCPSQMMHVSKHQVLFDRRAVRNLEFYPIIGGV